MRPALKAVKMGLLLSLLSCGDDTTQPPPPEPEPQPIPGWLEIRLTTPNADDGGILFTVSGGPISEFRTLHRIIPHNVTETSWSAVLAGRLTAGVVAEIRVPDVLKVDDYDATLVQVASGTTFQQRALAGYSLEVVSQP